MDVQAREGWSRARSTYGAERMADRYEALYRELTGTAGGAQPGKDQAPAQVEG
jgi:hypothetical protein